MASRYRSTCFVDGCDREPAAHGYCPGHYTQLRRHGRITGLLRTRGEVPDATPAQDRVADAQ
jgi:hypothetical protein